MKRIVLVIITIAILTYSFFPIKTAHASTVATLSLSDAVLADLALHNYIDYVSIDFKDKKSPNTITINENRQWLPASTVKLFVALYAADQIAKKNISLDEWVTIDDKNVVPTELETADYPVLTAGLTTTVDVLLRKMLTQSDNTAYNTLLDLLDRQKVTDYTQQIGLRHTIIGSKLNLDEDQTQYEYTTPGFNINTTTAADYEKAYELIDSGKTPGSSLLFSILKDQKIQNMIPALLPVKELTIAHKTGDLDPLYHDGGVIIGDNRHYILTIFTNLGNPNIIAHLSQLIFTKNYKLVGTEIPDKTVILQPQQALDPLVVNPDAFKNVLGATTQQINIPIPEITAADLGITPKDLSLVIPDNQLPPVIIPPSSPLHPLIPLWYGVEKAFALGEKNRQTVVLAYAKQLLADAKNLQKSGKTTLASSTLGEVEQVVKNVAVDTNKPDVATQITLKAISDTQFAELKKGVDSAKDETTRIIALQNIARTVREHLISVEPNIPLAKSAASTSQQPLLAHVVDLKSDHAVVETASGQTITVPLTKDTKIIGQVQQAATNIPTESPTASPTQAPNISGQPKLEKGATIALLGSIQGKVFTPSVIVTNLHRELAAPQPVTVVKVNVKNNTMVVSENGNPIQIDLGPQTPIKGKDTNVPLQAIQPGSVVVVHGTEVEQVTSDKILLSPTPIATSIPSKSVPNQPSAKPSSGVTSASDVSQGQSQKKATTPVISQSNGKQNISITSGKTSPVPSSSPSSAIPTVPGKSKTVPTTQSAPAAQTSAPKVIQATSVQVIQQKPNSPTVPSQQSTPKPEQPKPQQPAQNPPPATVVNSTSQENKNKGK